MSGSAHQAVHDAEYQPVFVGETRAKLEALFTRYPTRQACLLPALWMIQEFNFDGFRAEFDKELAALRESGQGRVPIDASAQPGLSGISGGFAGFSKKSRMRPSAPTCMTPNALASATGTSMQATVTSAPSLTCWTSIFS